MTRGGELARRLGLGDAVVVGLGAMIGAGVFAVLGPAADVAGSWLLLGLVVAAAVATCNALSSAALAAVHPESGGTYVYGRRRLGPFWGFLAGSGFVVGKTSSCAAMALTVGAYAAPGAERAVAVLAVVALTAVNLRGVTKTVGLTKVLLALVLLTLAVVAVAAVAGGTADVGRVAATDGVGPREVLQSAGLLFFAFAGYARIATLGEEVRDPGRTIPRAVPIALAGALAVYAVVAVTALLAVGPAGLAGTAAPLVEVVQAGRFAEAAPLVRAGAAVAALGVLLSLLVGVSRTTLAAGGAGGGPGRVPAARAEPARGLGGRRDGSARRLRAAAGRAPTARRSRLTACSCAMPLSATLPAHSTLPDLHGQEMPGGVRQSATPVRTCAVMHRPAAALWSHSRRAATTSCADPSSPRRPTTP